MYRYAQVFLLALLVVLASVGLRRATEAALGNEWQPSFSISGGTLAPLPPSCPKIGGAPVPSRYNAPRSLAIGGAPVPAPHVGSQGLMIGGAPVPAPHAVS